MNQKSYLTNILANLYKNFFFNDENIKKKKILNNFHNFSNKNFSFKNFRFHRYCFIRSVDRKR